ncbi:MAG: hypothetical protein LJF06_18945 [Gemmatimonadetes bacterium]|nr:hypothetical protein [Gemmatimonadota bacterium]
MPNRHLLLRLGATAALCLSAACSGGATGPHAPSVSGDWSGITAFPTQGRSSSMSLSQSGTSVTGTFSVAGAFADITVTGTVDASGRFSFLAPRNCEVWGGTLTVDGSSMSGPIVIDRSGCTAQSNESATLNLTR